MKDFVRILFLIPLVGICFIAIIMKEMKKFLNGDNS